MDLATSPSEWSSRSSLLAHQSHSIPSAVPSEDRKMSDVRLGYAQRKRKQQLLRKQASETGTPEHKQRIDQPQLPKAVSPAPIGSQPSTLSQRNVDLINRRRQAAVVAVERDRRARFTQSQSKESDRPEVKEISPELRDRLLWCGTHRVQVMVRPVPSNL